MMQQIPGNPDTEQLEIRIPSKATRKMCKQHLVPVKEFPMSDYSTTESLPRKKFAKRK
jgi:hypothetical protein